MKRTSTKASSETGEGIMNKKRVAREWLYFLACPLFGLIVMPFLVLLVLFVLAVLFVPDRHWTLTEGFGGFYSELVGMGEWTVIAWLIVVAPYILFQFVRAVIWAWKTIRTQ